MRIGIVTDNYFPSVGGTEISIWNYTRKLEELGHTVFVFCPSQGTKNPKKPRQSTVRLRSIRGIYPDHPIMFLYPGITKKFASYNLDVLHSQTPIAAPYIAKHVSKKLGIPHIATMHTLVPEQVKRWQAGLIKFLILYLAQSVIIRSFKVPKNYLLQDEKRTMPLRVRLSWIYLLRLVAIPDIVIFPTKPVRNIFKARGFTNKSEILPTFSSMFEGDIAKPHTKFADDGSIRVIYVGRLDIEKRPQVLIDAMNLLPDYLQWRLIIIGDGTQKNKLQRLVAKYGLEERVVFKGRKNQKEIAAELLNADIFVMTSYRFDTQGIVLLEACEAGLPIVYCDDNLTVGVSQANSILAKPYAMDMSHAIQTLIENPELRNNMAKASKDEVKKYNAKKLTKKLEGIYKKV